MFMYQIIIIKRSVYGRARCLICIPEFWRTRRPSA